LILVWNFPTSSPTYRGFPPTAQKKLERYSYDLAKKTQIKSNQIALGFFFLAVE
jgi:hypothetical protein